ncbi:MAG: thiol oxidoreductase [Fimbriimonadaceae bacterium]|nr:thiol oxidoreductase [Chitinophagales bacterium]
MSKLITVNKTKLAIFIIAGFVFIIHACSVDENVLSDWFNPEEYNAGGATTIFDASSAAFSTPADNLSGDNLQKHFDGDAEFEATFVTAPAVVNSGLGPIFNDVSCVGCHTLDGRGNKPTVFRISIPGMDIHNAPLAIPGYGLQLQNKAIFGVLPEGDISINYIEEPFYFPDGQIVYLRKPVYQIINTYAAIPGDVLLSVRVAPPVFGLGLLEGIPENSILFYADETDANKDGISGKANYVFDVVTESIILGRFGWKANQPNLDQQTAAAFNGDMGITSPLFQKENCDGQTQCDALTDDPEIDAVNLDVVSFYVKTLAVPAPRNLDNADVMEGKKYFFESGCNSCHVQKFTTGVLPGIPELSNQTIYPYTDLLLHDMGEGLADNRPDYLATGNEWKTRPLWGIGLTEVANGHTIFLHDGRARNLTEAILWHGGEAEKSKSYFANLNKGQREKLIVFLEAL